MPGAHAIAHERNDVRVHRGGIFERRHVSEAVEQDELRARNLVRDPLAVNRRGRGVFPCV